MKRFLKHSIAMLLCLCMTFSLAGIASAAPVKDSEGQYSLDLADYADQWVYAVDESGTAYYTLDVVYCSEPVDPAAQHMCIYVPAAYMQKNADGSVSLNAKGVIKSTDGVCYTAETAPILYTNTSGGYTSSKTIDREGASTLDIGFLNEGYVQVAIGTRGKETQDAEGSYIGQFPLIIVDLKAGVRFLKANNDVLPGNADRIISRGFSSGGAVSAMLGASGNSSIFDSYLKDIGAADATDDIFIAVCAAPITNLNSADASYEWYQRANDKYFVFNSMAFDREGNAIEGFGVGPKNMHNLGDNVLGGAHEDELSDLLYDWYVSYVQGLGFDLGDDGRSGEFYDGFAQIYSEALTEYIARYDELKTEKQPATVEEYLTSLGEGWFTYDAATGVATVASLDALVQNHIARKKMCPSLDSYNYKSNENDAFKDADGNTVHFSPIVEEQLKALIDNASEYNWTAEELSYIELLYGDYAAGINEDSTYMLDVMSPINYVVEAEGFEDADVAPYWRLRVGSEDGDHGAPAAWLISEGLKKYQPETNVSMGIAWGMGHSLSELTDQDLFDYIDGIMLAEDELPTLPFTDVAGNAWYLSSVKIANELKLIDGKTADTYCPDDNMTYAEAVKLACVIHQLNATGSVTLANGATDWYSTYMQYALDNGIIAEDLSAKANESISRQAYVEIFYKALPADKYTAVNTVAEGSIPDVAANEAVYAFYRAGILTGYEDGSFHPGDNIKRSEVAAVVVRMMVAGERK